MALKFLVIENKEDKFELLLGSVEWHKDLIKDKEKPFTVYGGGLYRIDKHKNVLYLFGQSGDFGKVEIEWLLEAIKESPYKNFTVYHSPWFEWFDCMKRESFKQIQ